MTSKEQLYAWIKNGRGLLIWHPSIARPRLWLGIICAMLCRLFGSWVLILTKASFVQIILTVDKSGFTELIIQTPCEESISTESSSTNLPTWTPESGERLSALH